jgi:hypothetical protein
MRIPEMSPEQTAEVVERFLAAVNTETRQRFITAVKPIIKKYEVEE